MIHYVVYDGASDINCRYAVRKFYVVEKILPELVGTDDDYEKLIRECIPPDLIKLDRADEDDPVIKEVWI